MQKKLLIKVSIFFVIKSIQKAGIEGAYYNIKSIYDQPAANIYLILKN